MFGGKKKAAEPQEAMVRVWKKRDIDFIAKSLKSREMVWKFQITGCQQVLSIDGRRYQSQIHTNRTDHELYSLNSLPFDGIPPHEDDVAQLIYPEFKLSGFLGYPRVKAMGYMSVEPKVAILKEQGTIGNVHLSGYENFDGMDPLPGEKNEPFVQFNLNLRNAAELSDICQTIETGILATKAVFVNVVTFSPDDPDGWVKEYEEKGYSLHLDAHQIFVTSQVGVGDFEW